MVKSFSAGKVLFGDGELVLVAGPCVLEDREMALSIAREVSSVCGRLGMPYVFKASFDKANRTSIHSFRGPGLEKGLQWLAEVRNSVGCPVLTDIHLPDQAERAAEAVDIIQIPAFLCRQTDLVVAAAATGRVVNIKKGQFLAPADMGQAVSKCLEAGNDKVILCERGSTFGYGQLVVDMRSLAIMRSLGYPVMFDATHSVQMPGAQGTSSGGDRRFVPVLARAAAAAGIDALFLEVHPDPDSAKSDGPNMVSLDSLENLLRKVLAVHRAAGAAEREE
ncbi:MAG TPA: 3-deoxy-8-phosphooctulonate synthase [Synergistales bacterium]|nr:3-deoxy-8-phosphooctulonate synthase [Synergistales bacterium]